MRRIKRTLRYLYYRFIRLRNTPEEVARGMAWGVFVGMTPTFPFQTALAVFLAMLLRESKFAAALGVWITNPLTSLPIFAFNYEVGRILLSMPRITFTAEHFRHMENLIRLGSDFFIALMAGSLVMGVITAFISYFITKHAYAYLARQYAQRRLWKKKSLLKS